MRWMAHSATCLWWAPPWTATAPGAGGRRGGGLGGGHDLVFALGAAAFTYHVEGFGPHVPPGAQLVQLIEDPGTAAWTPEGTSAVGGIRLGVLDLLARPAPPPRALPQPRPARPPVEPTGPLMSVPYVMQTLAEVRDAASIVVEEAPSSRAAMHAYLPIVQS